MADPENESGTGANTSTLSEDSTPVADTSDHDPYFEPVVQLPEISVKTNEEDEEEILKLRCKMFRYNTSESPPEWKERGTGNVKILKNSDKKLVRLVMRQDKTLKIRANHYISPFMELKPNCSSDRAWVWSVVADFADEEPKQELFAIKFANAENARLFKEKFDEGRGIATIGEVELREKSDKDEKTEKEKDEVTKEKAEEKEKEKNDKDKEEKISAKEVTKELEKMSVKGEVKK
ncbi:ran-specific GTPase-activating protein-like isoform X3 [Oratosquilla oratoria]|uniref:ran-specific GTPase-activating protein-like isoform X2 n=1 Tax=Oratosquilla oratoria TaxID=337810 RepID=UPI003F76DF1C